MNRHLIQNIIWFRLYYEKNQLLIPTIYSRNKAIKSLLTNLLII